MRRLAYVAAILPLLTVGAAGSVLAGETVEHPDDHPHNYYPGNATTCDDVDAAGMMLYASEEDQAVPGQEDVIQGTIYGDDDQFLDVELLDDSYTITAVVVKGAPNYTVYLEPPWSELHAPPIGWMPDAVVDLATAEGVKYPAISHWFVCGTQEEPTEPPTTPPTEPPTEEPTEPPTEEPTTPPTEEPSESPTAPPTEPSDTPSPSPTDDDDLPDTGSSPAVLIAAAAVLLMAGALALRNRFIKA